MLVQTVKAIAFMGCCGITLGMIHSLTESDTRVRVKQNFCQKIYLEPNQIAVEKSGLFIDLGQTLKPIEALYYDGKRFYIEEASHAGHPTCRHLELRQAEQCPDCFG